VPGAGVTIVKGNKIIFNKGYGFANLEEQRPVDLDRTLFRVVSVSKVFNAMAALTLVDRGLIGIEEDVRPRLAAAGLALDKTVDGPITLKALLTHTAGIRELYIANATLTTNRSDVLPLRSRLLLPSVEDQYHAARICSAFTTCSAEPVKLISNFPARRVTWTWIVSNPFFFML